MEKKQKEILSGVNMQALMLIEKLKEASLSEVVDKRNKLTEEQMKPPYFVSLRRCYKAEAEEDLAWVIEVCRIPNDTVGFPPLLQRLRHPGGQDDARQWCPICVG